MKLIVFSFFVILSVVSGCDSCGVESASTSGSSTNQGSGSGGNQSSNNPVPNAGKTKKTGKNLEELVDLGKPVSIGSPQTNPPKIVIPTTAEPIKPAAKPPAPVPATTVNPAPKPTVTPAPATAEPIKLVVTPTAAPVANPAPAPATTVNPAPKPTVTPAPAIAPDAKTIVDNIVDVGTTYNLHDKFKYTLYEYLEVRKKNKNEEIKKAIDLINAGILAKIFDDEVILEYNKKIMM